MNSVPNSTGCSCNLDSVTPVSAVLKLTKQNWTDTGWTRQQCYSISHFRAVGEQVKWNGICYVCLWCLSLMSLSFDLLENLWTSNPDWNWFLMAHSSLSQLLFIIVFVYPYFCCCSLWGHFTKQPMKQTKG